MPWLLSGYTAGHWRAEAAQRQVGLSRERQGAEQSVQGSAAAAGKGSRERGTAGASRRCRPLIHAMASPVRDNNAGNVEAAQCTPGEDSSAADMDREHDDDVYVEDTDQGTEDDEEDQESSPPRAVRDGGLSDYSSASSLGAACAQAKTEVQAAVAPAAQLNGSQEEMQVQAVLESFNSTGVPQVCSHVAVRCLESCASR